MLAKNGLDFAKFDAKAANLYLLVDSVEELYVTIRQIARAIAGLVQSRSRLAAEGVGNEILSGQIRTIQITASQTIAAYVEFPANSDWNRITMPVENVSFAVRERTPDRNPSES
jgi:hypothetical protein